MIQVQAKPEDFDTIIDYLKKAGFDCRFEKQKTGINVLNDNNISINELIRILTSLCKNFGILTFNTIIGEKGKIYSIFYGWDSQADYFRFREVREKIECYYKEIIKDRLFIAYEAKTKSIGYDTTLHAIIATPKGDEVETPCYAAFDKDSIALIIGRLPQMFFAAVQENSPPEAVKALKSELSKFNYTLINEGQILKELENRNEP